MFMANLGDAIGYSDQYPAGFCLSLNLNWCFFAGISVVFQFPPPGYHVFWSAAYSVRSATMERPTPDQVWMIGPSLPVGDWIQRPTVFPARMTFLTPLNTTGYLPGKIRGVSPLR